MPAAELQGMDLALLNTTFVTRRTIDQYFHDQQVAPRVAVSPTLPCDRLSLFIQRLWFARWWIPVREHRIQVVLPHPSANFVLTEESTSVFGVMTRSAVQRLEGNGMAFGAKLQPGALRAFGVMEPWLLRDTVVPASSLFRTRQPIYQGDQPQGTVSCVDGPRHARTFGA